MTYRQVPGGSSRTTDYTIQQMPMRDEADMSGTEEAGWSNSPEAPDAPKDVYPDVAAPEPAEPGFSNSKAVRSDAESKVVDSDGVEDKSVAPAKKTAAKKKG